MTLRKQTFSAGRWATLSSFARTGLYVMQTIVLARLLAPADFGVFAIAMAVYSVVAIFSDLGISNALIHFPKQPRSVLSSLYWINILAALLLFLLLALVAIPLTWFYDEQALYPAILTMAAALPISAAGQQFRVMAEKELNFATLAFIEITATAGSFTSAIVLALCGYGLQAMTFPLIASAIISSALSIYWLSAGFRPDLAINWRESIPFIKFGSYRIGETLSNTLRMQTDIFIGSLVAPASALGNYSLPRDLTLRASNTLINPIITRVSLPVLAKVQDDKAAIKSIFLSTLLLTASINFPVYFALMAWSDDVALLLLGSQWTQAGYFLQMFAIWGLIRSTGNPAGALLYATGQVRRAFWWNTVLLLLTPLCLLVPAYTFGLEGLTWAMIGLQVAIFYPAFKLLVQPACGSSFTEYLAQFAAPLAASAIATGAGMVASSQVESDWLQMPLGGGVCMLTYCLASLAINRRFVATIFEAANLSNHKK